MQSRIILTGDSRMSEPIILITFRVTLTLNGGHVRNYYCETQGEVSNLVDALYRDVSSDSALYQGISWKSIEIVDIRTNETIEFIAA